MDAETKKRHSLVRRAARSASTIYGVMRISYIGSVPRGKHRPDSDNDMTITYDARIAQGRKAIELQKKTMDAITSSKVRLGEDSHSVSIHSLIGRNEKGVFMQQIRESYSRGEIVLFDRRKSRSGNGQKSR